MHILINTWVPGTPRVQGGRTDERQGRLQEGKTRGVGKGIRWSRTGVGDARSRGKAGGGAEEQEVAGTWPAVEDDQRGSGG